MGRHESLNLPHQAGRREAGPLLEKRRRFSGLTAPAIFALSFGLVLVTLFLVALATGSLSSDGKRAAIVDQLALTDPNPGFIEQATDTLERGGYAVDYYPSDIVGVDLYRNLQMNGYDLIIFRAHTSRALGEWRGRFYNEAVLWTSEPYESGRYSDEQEDLRLGPVYLYKGATPFFGATAGFVRSSMRGNFDGATIIMMGCNGLTSDATAEAFLARGAEAVIGWDGDVSSIHTDATTDQLLKLLVTEGLTAEDAVSRAAARVGADPLFGGKLSVLTSSLAVQELRISPNGRALPMATSEQ
jgi:hypothetical protein